MHTGIIETEILIFTLGFLFGSIISAIIVKFIINRKIKNLYKILNEANLHRIKIKKEQENNDGSYFENPNRDGCYCKALGYIEAINDIADFKRTKISD